MEERQHGIQVGHGKGSFQDPEGDFVIRTVRVGGRYVGHKVFQSFFGFGVFQVQHDIEKHLQARVHMVQFDRHGNFPGRVEDGVRGIVGKELQASPVDSLQQDVAFLFHHFSGF